MSIQSARKIESGVDCERVGRSERTGEISPGCHREWPVGLDAPGDSLSRDRLERARWKGLRMWAILLGQPHHLTHVHYNLGEWQSSFLLGRHLSLNGHVKGVYVREEPLVVFRDEIA